MSMSEVKKVELKEVVEKKKEVMSKINGMMLYVGFILTSISAIAYLVLLYIIIEGFEVDVQSNNLIVYLGLGAVTGVMMNLSLRIQGVQFAKNEDASQIKLKQYQELIGKDNEVKLRPMWQFHAWQMFTDIIFKGGALALTLYFSITIIIQGMGDIKYFLLGIVNVIMYLGLGILSMLKGYNFYIENELPLLNQKINKLLVKEKDKNELSREVKTNSNGSIRSEREPRRIETAEVSPRRDSNSRELN